MEENFTIPRESAVMGLGAPKSDQLWPPGPVMLTSNRREAIPCVVMCSMEGPSIAITEDKARAKLVNQGANSAKISFAFFADVTCKHDCFRRCECALRKARERPPRARRGLLRCPQFRALRGDSPFASRLRLYPRGKQYRDARRGG